MYASIDECGNTASATLPVVGTRYTDKRDTELKVRLTRDEHRELVEGAQLEGRSLSDFVRSAVANRIQWTRKRYRVRRSS